MGGRAVAYARRQTGDTVALTIPPPEKTQNKSQHKSDQMFASRGGEFSHWKQDFKYGHYQRYCMRNIPILTYKAPWDSVDGKHHMDMSIFISRGRSQTADISA